MEHRLVIVILTFGVIGFISSQDCHCERYCDATLNATGCYLVKKIDADCLICAKLENESCGEGGQ